MEIKGQRTADQLILYLCGELDESTAAYSRNAIESFCEGSGFSSVIYDVSELTFMDSTGIGVLIGRYKKLKDRKIKVYIRNPSRIVDRIFAMAGLYEIMPKIG